MIGPGKIALRLRSLGLRPGARLKVLGYGPGQGPILLEVDGARLALGRGVARRVIVRPLP